MTTVAAMVAAAYARGHEATGRDGQNEVIFGSA
jgi:hypothetical protein